MVVQKQRLQLINFSRLLRSTEETRPPLHLRTFQIGLIRCGSVNWVLEIKRSGLTLILEALICESDLRFKIKLTSFSWLFGNKTQYLAPNQTKYEPGSTATKLPNETFYILYGDDSFASGPVYKDTVTVGSLKVPDQAVEVSNSGSGSYTAPMSGIVGLGFDSGNQGTYALSKAP